MNWRQCCAASILVSAIGCELFDNKKDPSVNKTSVCAAGKLTNNEPYTACNFICGEKYKSLVIEIDAIETVEPISDKDISLLEKILGKIISKPDGIRHVKSNLNIPLEKDVYSANDLLQIAKRNRSFGTKVLSLYVLYANGRYNKQSVAGIALDDGIIVIFKDILSAEYDKSVLMHEIGHHLGLVNIELSQQELHEDKEHKGHDVNDSCVMFYRIKHPLNYWFDRQCLEDIRSAREH